VFGRATITLGIGPHSSFFLFFLYISVLGLVGLGLGFRIRVSVVDWGQFV